MVETIAFAPADLMPRTDGVNLAGNAVKVFPPRIEAMGARTTRAIRLNNPTLGRYP